MERTGADILGGGYEMTLRALASQPSDRGLEGGSGLHAAPENYGTRRKVNH